MGVFGDDGICESDRVDDGDCGMVACESIGDGMDAIGCECEYEADTEPIAMGPVSRSTILSA